MPQTVSPARLRAHRVRGLAGAWFSGDMLRPVGPESVYDAPAEPIGYGGGPEQTVSYPGISELARRLGLK